MYVVAYLEELKAKIKAGEFREKTREEIEKAIEDEQEKLRSYQKISPMVNQQLAKRMNAESNVALIFQNFRVNLEDVFKQAGREADVPVVSDEEIEGLKLISETVEKKRVVVDAGIGRAQIPNGEDLSVRNVATSVLARALEIPDLVAESRIVEVNERGKIEKGLLMREVQGVTGNKLMEKYEGKTAQLTTNAIKQLMSLQIFDYICGQVDRHYNNFLMDVEEKNGKVVIKGITGIDNDLSFGSLAAQKIEEGMPDSRIQALRDDNGQPNLMGLDKGLAERIIAIKPTYVRYLLKPFLKENEIASALDRLKSVQQFLQDEREKYNKGEQSVLIGDEEQEKWEQIRDELNQDEAFDSDTGFMRISRERMKLKARSYIDPIMTGLERLKS